MGITCVDCGPPPPNPAGIQNSGGGSGYSNTDYTGGSAPAPILPNTGTPGPFGDTNSPLFSGDPFSQNGVGSGNPIRAVPTDPVTGNRIGTTKGYNPYNLFIIGSGVSAGAGEAYPALGDALEGSSLSTLAQDGAIAYTAIKSGLRGVVNALFPGLSDYTGFLPDGTSSSKPAVVPNVNNSNQAAQVYSSNATIPLLALVAGGVALYLIIKGRK